MWSNYELRVKSYELRIAGSVVLILGAANVKQIFHYIQYDRAIKYCRMIVQGTCTDALYGRLW